MTIDYNKVIEMLETGKQFSINTDGMISRFLFAAPKPIRLDLKKTISRQIEGFKLNHLIYGIYIINKKLLKKDENGNDLKTPLSFDDTAFELINLKFKEYENIA